MRVTDVRTILVTAPWKGDPFWALDEGRADQEFWRTAALIEVRTDEGITGLGETVMGYFAGETVPPVVEYYAHLLSDPANRLDPTQPERCFDELYQRSLWWGRVGMALSVLSGIEMALWDVAGKAPASRSMHCSAAPSTSACRSTQAEGRVAGRCRRPSTRRLAMSGSASGG